MKNLLKEFKHVEGLTDKRLVQTCKTVYNEETMKKEPLERAMEYAKMIKEHGTSFERLYIKNDEIYYGDKFECEDMIVCLVDYDCDRVYRIVFGSDDNKHITAFEVHEDGRYGMENIDITNVDDINTLNESDIVKEALRRMFISLGK